MRVLDQIRSITPSRDHTEHYPAIFHKKIKFLCIIFLNDLKRNIINAKNSKTSRF